MTTFPCDRAEHFAILAANVESAFEGAHVGWHGFLDDRRDAVAPVARPDRALPGRGARLDRDRAR